MLQSLAPSQAQCLREFFAQAGYGAERILREPLLRDLRVQRGGPGRDSSDACGSLRRPPCCWPGFTSANRPCSIAATNRPSSAIPSGPSTILGFDFNPISSTKVGGIASLETGLAATIRCFSLPPSRCSAIAVGLTPVRRAGIGCLPHRFCLQFSKRVRTSSRVRVSTDLRRFIVIPSRRSNRRKNGINCHGLGL